MIRVALVIALLGGGTAVASKPRCRLERIALGSPLRACARVVQLEGDVDDALAAAQFTLLVDGRPAGRATSARPFGDTDEELDVALVVETAAPYAPALEPLKAALRDLLEAAPRGT